jgi:hypothetical protein
LTEFYLWLSTGGVIGGIAAGLIAPHVFNWVLEYPVLIVLAAFCRPNWRPPTDARERTIWLGAIAAGAAVLIPGLVFKYIPDDQIYRYGLGALLALSLLLWNRTLLYGATVALVLLASQIYQADYGPYQTLRSFFGVHKIYETETSTGTYRVLTHGTTTHGAQHIADAEGKPVTGRPANIMYYYDDSAIGQAMRAVRERKGAPIRYAVIGLGAGSLACRMQRGDTLHYYEIDPLVIRIASDTGKFTYLSSCTPNIPVVAGNTRPPAATTQIVLGDARLTLADAPDGFYDMIIVDAFSSDAIPVHLLTREAMAIYRRKLAPAGVVVMHVSNRHLELATVVAGIAHANNMAARVHNGQHDTEADDDEYKYLGTVTAAARNEDDFRTFNQFEDWKPIAPDPKQWVWTDDYSNIIGSMLRHYGYRR